MLLGLAFSASVIGVCCPCSYDPQQVIMAYTALSGIYDLVSCRRLPSPSHPLVLQSTIQAAQQLQTQPHPDSHTYHVVPWHNHLFTTEHHKSLVRHQHNPSPSHSNARMLHHLTSRTRPSYHGLPRPPHSLMPTHSSSSSKLQQLAIKLEKEARNRMLRAALCRHAAKALCKSSPNGVFQLQQWR